MSQEQDNAPVATNPPAGVVQMSSGTRRAARRPQAILKSAVRRLEQPEDWGYAIQCAPALLAFALNLARYLSVSVPAVNGACPLLVRCIGRGIDSWLATAEKNEPTRFQAFIRGVLYPLPEALEWTLRWDNGEQVVIWNPLEQCVCDWWKGNGGFPEARRRVRPDDSAYVELSPADFRLIVLVRFLAREPIALSPLSPWLDELVTRYG